MPIIPNRVFLLARCMRRDYAEDMFYNGNLFFNYPVCWIGMGEDGDEGQGDSFEGVYTNIISDKTKRLRKDVKVVQIKNKLYLRSESVINKWPCMCFYSVSELTDKKIENGSFVYDMAKDYIDSFSKGETFKSMLDLDLQKRTSMVIIKRTGEFFRKIRGLFAAHGLVEFRDFFMQSVSYRKKGIPFIYAHAPMELLYKEGQFKNQQEFRIILNPNNPKVLGLLAEGHKLCIGSMEDYAVLKTNFYNGAKITIKENTIQFIGANWQNMLGPLNEWNLKPLLGLMQGAYHTTSCVMDGEQMGIHAFWVQLTNVFASKYKLEIRYEEYDDNKDDHILLIPHGDNIDIILKNEEKDSYYYIKNDNGYKAPSFDALLGGFPPGVVNVTYWIRKKSA